MLKRETAEPDWGPPFLVGERAFSRARFFAGNQPLGAGLGAPKMLAGRFLSFGSFRFSA